MNRYIIQTLVTCKGKTFLSKESFKKWFVENLVPQDSEVDTSQRVESK